MNMLSGRVPYGTRGLKPAALALLLEVLGRVPYGTRGLKRAKLSEGDVFRTGRVPYGTRGLKLCK